MVRFQLLVAVCVLLISQGCGMVTDPPPETRDVQIERREAPVRRAASQSSTSAFTNRILRASSTNGVITDAKMRGTNELGVVLGRKVELSKVKPLMVTLLKEMRKEFPNRDLTVRAYAPNGKHMATMAYDDSAPSDSNVTYDPKF